MKDHDLEEIYNAAIDGEGKTVFDGLRAVVMAEREACANSLNLTRSEVQLMAGELTAQEWRTVGAVLLGLQSRMRSNIA